MPSDRVGVGAVRWRRDCIRQRDRDKASQLSGQHLELLRERDRSILNAQPSRVNAAET